MEELQRLLYKRQTVLLGIGRRNHGDDAAGPLLAEKIGKHKFITGLICEELTENYTDIVQALRPQTVLLSDAVDFKGQPGQVVLMKADDLNATTVSAHHASLQPLMRYLEMTTGGEVRLLGIQPAALVPGTGTSRSVNDTIEMLRSLLLKVGIDEEET